MVLCGFTIIVQGNEGTRGGAKLRGKQALHAALRSDAVFNPPRQCSLVAGHAAVMPGPRRCNRNRSDVRRKWQRAAPWDGRARVNNDSVLRTGVRTLGGGVRAPTCRRSAGASRRCAGYTSGFWLRSLECSCNFVATPAASCGALAAA